MRSIIHIDEYDAFVEILHRLALAHNRHLEFLRNIDIGQLLAEDVVDLVELFLVFLPQASLAEGEVVGDGDLVGERCTKDASLRVVVLSDRTQHVWIWFR